MSTKKRGKMDFQIILTRRLGSQLEPLTLYKSEINHYSPFVNNTTRVEAIINGKAFDFIAIEPYEEIKEELNNFGFKKVRLS